METFKDFIAAFIPVFVAVDAIGVLPIYISLTKGVNSEEKKRVIVQSVITGLCLAMGFIFLGKAVFHFLNITVEDFMVAGGTVLFCIAITDITNPTKHRRSAGRELGAVPLGTPLIVGPGVLTTSLSLSAEYGVRITSISLLLNILLAGLVFASSDRIMNWIGQAGTKALSKIFSLLLASIAVMMIRKGIVQIIKAGF